MPTRLRYWRERRSLTQQQLAELSAVGIATVRRIEAGHDTYLGTIEKLATALRIKPWHLIDWSGSITARPSTGQRPRK
ncbi:MAG TPA: helix-turn-helix transcriptional regulator [Chloroflexota bacterium]|jgi:transcriptional regulator with XRE-family HTH domain|nr:helix-turn-helix transcriptional regulator [Chloroflexota bacterium]